jgi:hypothetical protein
MIVHGVSTFFIGYFIGLDSLTKLFLAIVISGMIGVGFLYLIVLSNQERKEALQLLRNLKKNGK